MNESERLSRIENREAIRDLAALVGNWKHSGDGRDALMRLLYLD